jgi:protein-tyrosine phosphatase
MAAAAADDGITTIIATPHTDGIRVGKNSVEDGVRLLNTALQGENLGVEILAGYEIPSYLFASLGKTHTLAGSSYVLVEFPHTHLPADAMATVTEAIANKLRPIIAHPERNPDILARPALLEGLTDAGALAQLTAASLIGEEGPDIQHCSHHLLKKGLVHFIATDSHSPSFRRPVLSEARRVAEKIVGPDAAAALMTANPERIIRHGRKTS